MKRIRNRKKIVYCCLFLSFYLWNCTRPGDNPLNEKELDKPVLPFVPEKKGPQLYTVEISGMKFQPENITVHSGDTIVWINNDITTHCVTEEATKAWTSSNILKGSSWKMVVKGSCNYYCAIHQVMKGRIIVE